MLRKISLVTICIAVTVFLIGCQTTQLGSIHLSDIGRYTSLKKGESTKKDVFISFGQPCDVIENEGGGSQWRYYKIDVSMSGATFVPIVNLVAGGSNSQLQISTFTFDKGAYYVNVETSDRQDYTNQWAGMAKAASLADSDSRSARVESEMNSLNLPFDSKFAKQMADLQVFWDR